LRQAIVPRRCTLCEAAFFSWFDLNNSRGNLSIDAALNVT
jgi:hypothetical protein